MAMYSSFWFLLLTTEYPISPCLGSGAAATSVSFIYPPPYGFGSSISLLQQPLAIRVQWDSSFRSSKPPTFSLAFLLGSCLLRCFLSFSFCSGIICLSSQFLFLSWHAHGESSWYIFDDHGTVGFFTLLTGSIGLTHRNFRLPKTRETNGRPYYWRRRWRDAQGRMCHSHVLSACDLRF